MVFYSRFLKPSRNYLRGFLIAALAGDKIAEFSFPEILFHFPLRPCFFFVSPAYAGKSLMTRLFLNRNWDHPRVCGEKLLLSPVSRARSGSPPRMRGKAAKWFSLFRFIGITPAYAGEKSIATARKPRLFNHPRVCGGKVQAVQDSKSDAGITPAYAGKSHPPEFQGSAPWDHPRVCGEKSRFCAPSGPK